MWCRSSCSLWGDLFPCRGSLGTATLHDLQDRRKDLLLASSGFRETSSTGLATRFMLRQFFNWILGFIFFLRKASFSQFLVNNLSVADNFHLQTFILVAREWGRTCVYSYLYTMYMYTYVCACIFVYTYMHTLFNHFYCLLHDKLSMCDSVSEYIYLGVHPKSLVYQWCTVLSSHKPYLPRKAKCTCIVCKLIGGKQSIHIS